MSTQNINSNIGMSDIRIRYWDIKYPNQILENKFQNVFTCNAFSGWGLKRPSTQLSQARKTFMTHQSIENTANDNIEQT